MKKKSLTTQYDASAQKYEHLHINKNKKSTKLFLATVAKYLPNEMSGRKRLLDIGCGAGTDFDFYLQTGFSCSGMDSSLEMVNLSRKNYPTVDIRQGNFSGKSPFYRESFNIVVSKWAMQTARNIKPIYSQVRWAMHTYGYFIFLVVHPFRQFIEKKKRGKNYFKKEIVASRIFAKKITVYEPTHTLQEYLSPYFLEHFDLIEIKEDYEFPAAEQIGGDIYPTHLIIVARKR